MKCFKNLTENEEGSALPTVLIIIVIITVFIGAVLSGIYIQNRFIQRDVDAVKARYTAEAGIYQFLDQTAYTRILKDSVAVLYTGDSSRVAISVHPLGGFLDITSTTDFKNQTKTIRVLVGEKKPEWFEKAVILGDTNSELFVTGKTTITGDIVTGQHGVRPTRFKGYPFSGSLNGDNERKKGRLLPVFNSSFLQTQVDNFENELLGGVSNTGEGINEDFTESYLSSGDTIFVNGNTSWVSEDSLKIPQDVTFFIAGNLSLKGNYEFGRFSKIIVRDTLLVGGSISGNQMLLYAGKTLQVGGAVNLSCQCLSGNDIVIRDNAYLRYPSLLYSGQEYSTTDKTEIIDLRDNAIVDGMIIYPVEQSGFTAGNFRVKIDESAMVRGGVYSLTQTELKGKIFGSILSRQFYFYESPTSYNNWLKDIEIDISKRPEDFAVPLGFTENPKYQVLEWMEIN